MAEIPDRLTEFLRAWSPELKARQLTPDASTREYFRITFSGKSAIVCVYPEAFIAEEQSYLDVTKLFKANGLPVAEVLAFDGRLGIIVLEDFGDTILRDVLADVSEPERERLLAEAIRLIAKIQASTQSAYDTGSIASRLKFDVEKLMWELDFFRSHYFETFRKQPLPMADAAALDVEFRDLARELDARGAVLCHRDFHAANLMVDASGRLRIIDHQDARIGSAAYDLVSLVLDRITEPPTAEWLASKRQLLIDERITCGLGRLDEADFTYEFRLQTIQRCLKAAGTFSFQSANRGRTHFIPFIKPMFRISLRAAENLDRFPLLQTILAKELQD